SEDLVASRTDVPRCASSGAQRCCQNERTQRRFGMRQQDHLARFHAGGSSLRRHRPITSQSVLFRLVAGLAGASLALVAYAGGAPLALCQVRGGSAVAEPSSVEASAVEGPPILSQEEREKVQKITEDGGPYRLPLGFTPGTNQDDFDV